MMKRGRWEERDGEARQTGGRSEHLTETKPKIQAEGVHVESNVKEVNEVREMELAVLERATLLFYHVLRSAASRVC